MRYLVLLLLVLNLAYFAWGALKPESEMVTQLPPLPQGVTELTLLSEREPVALSLVSKTENQNPGSEAASEQAEPVLLCYTLGPLTSEKSRDTLITRLQDLDVNVESRSLEQRETIGYWVFLPPLENRKAALAIAEELAKKGIKDYYVVTDDEYRHAVSLGLFSEKARADRRMAHIRTLGYKPQKIVRYRDRTYYWLDYQLNGEEAVPDAVWKDLSSGKEKIQKLDRSCN